MELKRYQDGVLKDLDNYINNILDTGNAAKAYDKLWTDKGVRVGGTNGIQLYKDTIPGVPTICFKVPTGGGKTILGCASLKHIFDAMGRDKKKVVVWLVPWETILTQTYNNLKNPSHFYRERLNRDFASKVEIYNKQQVLDGANFNPSSINEQLSVIVMSFDSLRAKNKDDRKVYEENPNLMPFVETYGDRDGMIRNVDDSALMQVLNQMKPVVIIDESHNAQTDLSKEMIKNLNPSFVVELTATPKGDSNIISIVTANQLKEDCMVKLPVIAYNRPSKERVVVEAIDLRNALEEAARRERTENQGPYIRPIVLFQAQPRNDDDSVTFDTLKRNLVEAGIPAEQIAIKTANVNELNGADLMSEDCKIRYIITINALKEGWDCPFAYILASLANRTSSVDVEQILGRILRQPHQRNYQNKILNMSYVLTSSADFNSTLEKILVGLNSSGFSRNDCRVVRTNTLDNLTETREEQTPVQGDIFEGQTSESENVDANIFNTAAVHNEIGDRGDGESHEPAKETQQEESSGSVSQNDNIINMLDQATAKGEEYEAEVEESQREGTADIPEEFRTYTNVFHVKNEHKEEIRNLELPIFCFKKEGTIFSGDDSIYPVDTQFLNDGFNLSGEPIPSNITTSSDDIYKVDVETTADGSVIKKSLLTREDSSEFKRHLSLLPESARVSECKRQLVSFLNNRFDNISQGALTDYIERIVNSLTTEDEIVVLQNNIYSIAQRIRDFIAKRLEEYRYSNFKAKITTNEIFIKKDYKLQMSITLPDHTNSYLRTLYEEEDARVNSLETRFMEKISSQTNIKWWHRNVERVEYSINGFINHYPDFILETNSGVIVLVETKGEHLDGDDSKKKLELGKLWSNNSGQNNYKYFMAFDHSPLQEDGADLLDNIINVISRL